MYAKLVLRNVKRSVNDYLVYIVTMTICVMLFYSFLSISSDYYRPDIGSEYNFTILSDGMKAAICAITLVLLFLIRFVNHCMLRRRQKEFAIQSVLGMEQKIIARLFFAETFVMGMISIVMGIFLGVFCSQFITAMLLTSYGKSYELVWTLFPDTVLLTVSFFVLSFLVTGLFNIRTIRKTKIIDMLAADRKNDPELKKRRWIFVMAVFFELFTVWAFDVGITKAWFYYDARFAPPVQFMYLGNILFPAIALGWPVLWLFKRKTWDPQKLIHGLLVCSVLNAFAAVSVPALTNRYYLSLGNGMLRQYLLFALIDLIFFICSLIYLAGSFLIAWKEKSPEYRYKDENLFFFGQITSKLNTTSKTMTLISVTLVLAVFLFIAAPILTGWASGYLDMRSVYDIQIFTGYNDVYDEENLPRDDYEIITDYLAGYGIETDYDCTFSLYLPRKENFHRRIKYDFPVAVISLSDYNTIREMLGYEPVSLSEDEFTTQWRTVATEEERTSFLAEHTSVMTDAGKYKYRFSVLRKMGVEEQQIGKLVLKQLGVWFGLPVLVAVIVSSVVIIYFIQTISAEISAYIGLGALMTQMGVTAGILVLLLICYFLSTWILFKRSISQ